MSGIAALMLVGVLAGVSQGSAGLIRDLEVRVAQPLPVLVYVSHSGMDSVGRRLALQVRNLLRDSKLYPLAATARDAQVRIDMVTMDSDDGERSVVAQAIVLQANDTLLHLIVRTVGRSAVDQAAESIVSDVDELAVRIREQYAQ